MSTTTQEKITQKLPIRDSIFSELAIRGGKVTSEAIQKGCKVLDEMIRFGINRSLSSILVERKLMDPAVEKEMMRQMGGIHLPCAQCRQKLSLEELTTDGHLRCDHCQSILLVTEDGVGTNDGPRIEERLKANILEGGKPGKEGTPPGSGRKGQPGGKGAPPAPAGHGAKKAPHPGDGTDRSRQQTTEPPKTEEPKTPKIRIAARTTIRRYQIEGVLASGPWGRLYRGRPAGAAVDSPRSAIKVLVPERVPDAKALASLKGEVGAWSRIDGNVPGTYALEDEAPLVYLVRPCVEPPFVSLADLPLEGLQNRDALLRSVVVRLKAAHEAGRIHGNLKPSNVFVNPETPDRVILVDPGLHFILPKADKVARWKFLADAPRCVAPEVIDGEEPTAASDVYALGWVLYAVLAKVPPFAGLAPPDILRRHREGPCPDLAPETGLWRDLHRAMTAVDPKERPNTAAVLEMIDGVMAGKKPAIAHVKERTTPSEVHEVRRLRRKPRLLLRYVLGPAALVAVIAWVSITFASWSRAQKAFNDPDRNRALYHDLASEVFAETASKARLDPSLGRELWDRFLRSFSNTPLQGAAEAEKRNFPGATGAGPSAKSPGQAR